MTVHTVGPGGNYSTLTAWEAAIPTGTLTEDREAAMFNYVDAPANNWAIAGFTTTASAKLIVRAATAAETGNVSAKHNGLAGTGARITKTGGTGYQCLRITDTAIRHFEFRDLSFFSNGTAANQAIAHAAATDYSRIINCIGYSFNYGGFNLTPSGATGDHLIANCALWDSIAGHGFVGNAAVNIVHCTAIRQATFVASSLGGFRTAVVKNCYAANWGGSGGFLDFGALVAGSSNNASLDASGSAGLTGLAPANQFVNVGAPWDLHLKAGSALEGAATAFAVVVTDFEGDERDASTPDIGFDELVTAGAPEIVGVASPTLARMTLASSGTLEIAGIAQPGLARMTVAATGTLEDVAPAGITGTASITLGRATAASAGTLGIAGQAAPTLARMSVASASTLTLSGTAGLTLARMTVTAAGAGPVPITGSGAVTLGRMSVSATSVLPIAADAAVTLGQMSVSATGFLTDAPIAGVANVALRPMSVTAVGALTALPQFGALSVTLRRMRSASTGVVRQPPTGEIFAREQSVIPPVAFDQSPTGWPQWLREIAQSINLMSSWVGTSTTPGGEPGSGDLDTRYVATTGDTMTGSLDLTGAYDPTTHISVTRLRFNGCDFAGDFLTGDYRYQVLFDASGNGCLYLGNATDPSNYHQQTFHGFYDRPGTTEFASFSATGANIVGNTNITGYLRLGSSFLYLGGGTGTVNAPGGPLIYGDSNYLVLKPGSNNLGVWLQAYDGSSVATIGPNGITLDLGSYYHYGTRLVGASAPNTGHNLFYTNDGSNIAIFAGGTNDRTNYYRNTAHAIQSLNGGVGYTTFNTNGLTVDSGYLNVVAGDLLLRSKNILRVDTANNSTHLYTGAGVYFLYAIANTTWYDTAIHNFRNAAHGTSFAQFDSTSTKNVSGAWATISDASLKDDIAPYEGSLDAIAALRPVSYRYKPDTPFADPDNPRRLLGLLAHEVEDLFPEIVGEMEVYKYGTVKTLEPGLLIYPLINAVRELKERLERVEANGTVH